MLCTSVYSLYDCVPRAQVEVRRWPARVYGLWGPNSGCQTWWQVLSPAEPPCWLLCRHFLHARYTLRGQRRRTHLLQLLISPCQATCCAEGLSPESEFSEGCWEAWPYLQVTDEEWARWCPAAAWEPEYAAAETGLAAPEGILRLRVPVAKGKMTISKSF